MKYRKQKAESRKQEFESCLLPPVTASCCGFTLVETLVAIAIMTLAVAGPLYTANRAIVAAEISRDQLIASYLAQEGIEYVRSMRDNEYLAAYRDTPAVASSAGWTSFLNLISTTCSTSCQFEPADMTLNACSGAYPPCKPLYLAVTHIYTQRSSSGTVTPFTRTIQATAVTGNDEQITSRVTWSSRGAQYSVTIVVHLTPWQ